MTTTIDDVERRIADRLRSQRETLGWSLGALAEHSGVSKAMIARVERGEASPTAALLGRLCAGLGITLTALMAAAEMTDATRWTLADQTVWQDPATGLVRRLVGTPLAGGGAEIARLTLPPGTVISYEMPPRLVVHQHLVMLAGALRFTVGHDAFDLAPGDCVGARIDRPTRFEVLGPDPAEYLVVSDRGRV